MPKRPIRADDLLRIVYVGDPQISPDGERVLFGKKTIDAAKNRYVTHLFTVNMEGELTQWTQGETSASYGRWSADGRSIAFLASRDKAATQIYVISAGGGEARKLTNLPEGSIGGYQWSPDGTKIAFSFREQIEAWKDSNKKDREEKGLSREPMVTEDIWYRLDGDGYFGMQRYRIYVVEVASGKLIGADDKDWLYAGSPDGNYSFDWSPNSDELAVIHTSNKRPMADPPHDGIWRIDMRGQAWRLEGLPKGSKSDPRWSPDGRWIAYSGDVHEDDPWGTYNTKLYVVDAKGGEPTDLTGAQDYDFAVATLSDTKEAAHGASFFWAPDSSGLYAEVGWHGETQVAFVSRSGGVQILTDGQHHIGIGNVSRDGRRLAAMVGNATRLPEIAVIEAELGSGRMAPHVLTGFNRKFHEEIALSEPEEFWIDSTDGTKLHGWVMKPIGYLEPRRYAAALTIHGGPHTQYGRAFFHEFQVMAAEGYVVVYTNPRGSKGYGEDWCRAIQGDWGNKDWEDIQTVTRWMQHQPYIHPGQMAVMGGSYGGYMTNWVIGHTGDFRCAISDRCVSNMVSMAGNSDFPFNKDGYFKGVAWGDLESIRELWRQSPIAYFENVKTPTLVIHSEGDLRCNVEQGEQIFNALQMQGIESRFVRYPSNTSHGMSRSGPPDMRLHRLGEMTSWLARFLK